MKKAQLLSFITILILVAGCGGDDIFKDCQDINRYNYNSTTGLCENCKGEIGFNEFNIENIRKGKNIECYNLSNKTLVYLLDTAKIEGFHEFGQNLMEGYNFNGCVLDSAELFFNDIRNSSFEGADLSYIEFGYANIHGSIDKFTKLPLNGNCSNVFQDSINCIR